jgi:hypothetical protein
MNGADYIDFAAKIAATYPSAAGCRSAISRAYYGAFHISHSFLKALGTHSPRNANTHSFVQHRLMNCGNATAEEAGRSLTELHRDRLLADYNLQRTRVEDADYAKAGVITARQVQRLIEACDNDEIRQEIKTGIAEYERKILGG